MDIAELRDRLARLCVEYAANVQPGQVVCINAEYGHHELVRALAAHAYERGASRLDADDPAAAWRERFAQTRAVADQLTARRFDAVHFEGPGTDLTIGLLPTSSWRIANETTPLVLGDGTRIDGITVSFSAGRAVEVDAERGGEALRTRTSVDDGARRLGEVALVDREGRIGRLGTVFSNTLIDENASSHLALGSAYETMVGEEDVPRINRSDLHLDFMIGSDEVAVTGITREGERVPVLRGGSWQF